MSTPAPIHAWPDQPAAQFPEAQAQVGEMHGEAANDPASSEVEENDYRNPLWLIAIAGGCLFAAMAALLALG